MLTLLITFRNGYGLFHCIGRTMSKTQGGFKIVLVHSLTSQMSELLSTTVELGGKKDKYHISILFILKLRLSILGSCSFWLPQFFSLVENVQEHVCCWLNRTTKIYVALRYC